MEVQVCVSWILIQCSLELSVVITFDCGVKKIDTFMTKFMSEFDCFMNAVLQESV